MRLAEANHSHTDLKVYDLSAKVEEFTSCLTWHSICPVSKLEKKSYHTVELKQYGNSRPND